MRKNILIWKYNEAQEAYLFYLFGIDFQIADMCTVRTYTIGINNNNVYLSISNQIINKNTGIVVTKFRH